MSPLVARLLRTVLAAGLLGAAHGVPAQALPTESAPQIVLGQHAAEVGAPLTSSAKGSGSMASPAVPSAVEPISLFVSMANPNIRLSWSGHTGPVDVVASWDRLWRKPKSLRQELDASMLDILPGGVAMQVQYLAVTDGSTVSPAEQNFGYNPREIPVVPALATSERWWGDDLAMQTTGIDPIREANRLEFPYQAIAPQEAGFNPSGTVTFKVPYDARGGYLFLHANNTRSNNGQWLTMRPQFTDGAQSAVTFSAITSIAWVSCSAAGPDYLYISEAQGIWQLSMMKTTPTAVQVGGVNAGRYLLSRAMNNHQVLFISSNQGNPPVQFFDGCASAPVAGLWAQTTDNAFTRSFRAAGIAASPAGDYAYLADASQGYTIRVPLNAGPGSSTITDKWGGNTVLSFADPAGIDVAESGTLLVTTQSPMATYRIPAGGGSTVWDRASNFVIHSLQIDHEVSDASFHRNYATGNLGIALVGNQATHMGGLVYALADRVVLEPNSRYGATNLWPERVLLSNPLHDGLQYSYPSQYQTTDRILRLQFGGWGNVTQYLRVVDPPDTAPYAPLPPVPPAPTLYLANDNTATVLAATDWGLTTDPAGVDPAPQKCLAVTPTSDSVPVTVYLKVPANFAGDNFRVEVSKQDWGTDCSAANTVEFVTPRYTSWKRIFIERDKMFRRGGLLSQPAVAPADSVMVAKTRQGSDYEALDGLEVGQKVVIFDTDAPFDNTRGVLFDMGCIRSMNTVDRNDDAKDEYEVVLGRLAGGTACVEGSPLTRIYVSSSLRDANMQWTFEFGRSAGIGVIGKVGEPTMCDSDTNQKNKNSCFYDVDIAPVQRLFDDAFVDVIAPPVGMTVVPFMGIDWLKYEVYGSDTNGLIRFNQKWFKHFVPNPSYVPPKALEQNYFQFIAASDLTNTSSQDVHGVTASDYDFSMSFWHAVDRWCSGNEQLCLQHTSVHELGHQFNTNPCSTGPEHDHCLRNAWCSDGHCGTTSGDPFWCTMHYGYPADEAKRQAKDGVDRFCKEDLFLGDHVCTSWAPGQPRPGAVRTTADPK